MHYDVIEGECLATMRSMDESSVDAVVCDPPYGLSFMGKEWDSFGTDTRQPGDEHYSVPDNPYGRSKVRYGYGSKYRDSILAYQESMTPIFTEILRVAKPGTYLLCFGGTRTFHRLACAIEDAGWELRDTIMYVYGSGYPKGMDVSKAIDKALGAERKVVGQSTNGTYSGSVAMNHGRKESFGAADGQSRTFDLTEPATDVAKQWDGWNTQIKPAWEPIIVARKPLDGTVVHNIMTWGVGAMNIDGCRVPTEPHNASRGGDVRGRFPANLIHDGSDEVLELFPDKAGQIAYRASGGKKTKNCYGDYPDALEAIPHDALGSAARFFYCAKASKSDRNLGCEDYLTWERDQELTPLLEKSNQLIRGMCASGTPKAEDMSLFTESSGSGQTGLSQTEWLFITSTVTRLTTGLKTSNSSHLSNINESILDVIRTSEESGISLARLADKLRNSRLDSTKEGTDSAINAVSALFDALCEIRKLAREGNFHPTIKPNALMRYLVRLVCPKGGIVLDPFMGSGSTGVACMDEDMSFVGIELDGHYCDIARMRIEAARQRNAQMSLFEE